MVSGTELFLSLFNNLAIFIVLVAVYGFLNAHFDNSRTFRHQTFFGLSFGIFAIACMHIKIPVAQGVIVDQRNTIVALSGAFGGPLSAIISSILAGTYRFSIGGEGVLGGIVGVSLSAVAGTILHYLRKRRTDLFAYFIGVFISTIIILPGFLFIKNLNYGWTLLKAMSVPYGAAIFLGIYFVGLLLMNEENRYIAKKEQDKSEKKYRNLFDSLIDLSYQTDLNGIILIVSPSSKKIIGYEPSEIIGQPIQNFYRIPSMQNKLIDQLQKKEKIENFSTEIKRKDGTFVWVSTNANFLKNHKAEIIGIQGISRDISQLIQAEQDKKTLEQHLRQSQKMEAIGTLARGIAHDFNNILSGILGNAELSLYQMSKDKQNSEYLESIIYAVDRAKDLTNQILTFSRNRMENKKLVQLHSLIEEALKLLKQTIPSTVTINFSFDSNSNNVMVNSSQIHQIIMNLCTNAYHSFDKEKGKIDIKLKSVTVKSKDSTVSFQNIAPGQYVELVFQDNGSGIKPENLARIYDPYFTTKKQGKGTGLGLSVVHGIILDHEGTIEVKSEVGKGTQFRIFFPVNNRQQLSSEATSTIELYEDKGTENILLIDDELEVIKVNKMILENVGYKVYASNSSTEAFKIFCQNPDSFDLIITDQTMPELSGDELIQKILNIKKDIPIIICTGYSSVIDEATSIEIGAKAFLMKPIKQNKLLKTIRQVINDQKNIL